MRNLVLALFLVSCVVSTSAFWKKIGGAVSTVFSEGTKLAGHVIDRIGDVDVAEIASKMKGAGVTALNNKELNTVAGAIRDTVVEVGEPAVDVVREKLGKLGDKIKDSELQDMAKKFVELAKQD